MRDQEARRPAPAQEPRALQLARRLEECLGRCSIYGPADNVRDLASRLVACLEADRSGRGGVRAEEWRCFHCGDVFTDEVEARDHFGWERECSTPACKIGCEELQYLRGLEIANAELRAENDRLDNDARLYRELRAEVDRLTNGHGLFMELDYREGEKIALTARLQQLYDATTWLISVAPTGRLDLGASRTYHDAIVALTTLRAELRRNNIVTHDESQWQRHLKLAAALSPADPAARDPQE